MIIIEISLVSSQLKLLTAARLLSTDWDLWQDGQWEVITCNVSVPHDICEPWKDTHR